MYLYYIKRYSIYSTIDLPHCARNVLMVSIVCHYKLTLFIVIIHVRVIFRVMCMLKIHDLGESLPAQRAALDAGIRMMRAHMEIRNVDDLLRAAFPD